jgi:GntR family transcriptional regulator, transcriptional repressor for pyruvate dehydrogenase complex
MSRGPQPAYERLADTIRDQILSGQLRPGDQLPIEPELSARYNVSRSTVREALRVLASQKLVITTRGVTGGSFVNQPGPEHVQSMLKTALAVMASADGVGTVDNLIEVRHMLEVPAAGLAAERRTDEQLADLRSSLFDPRNVDVPTVFKNTRSFHAVVLDAANNPMLAAVTAPIFLVLQERFAREQAGGRFWQQVDKDHRTILALIEARDAEGARQAQAEHLTRLRNTYVRIDRQARASASSASAAPAASAGTAGAAPAKRGARRTATRRVADDHQG